VVDARLAVTAPVQLAAGEIVDVLGDLDLPKYEDYDALYAAKGPRVAPTGMLPYPAADGSEVHALMWGDGLVLVSHEVFGVLP
jgi:hypothetical protein